MLINDLNTIKIFKTLFERDKNNRVINLYNIKDVMITGKSLYYPNTLLLSKDKLINPVNEKIMSLEKLKKEKEYTPKIINPKTTYNEPVFFFIYNTDNYFHFIYDTLPYLISFFDLRETIPNIKLLMSYPNNQKNSFYKFVIDYLTILGIKNGDIILVSDDIKYSNIYISSSYTHGENSNLPPREEIYNFFQKLKKLIPTNPNTPKKIYISRRSWVHGDTSNMGTNYTSKRKLVNEDDLVNLLTKKYGFTEVFTETISTEEKINYFTNAEIVVGPIGGGLVNVLFSNKECKLISINSPFFLDINQRFTFSFKNIQLIEFNKTIHTTDNDFKLFMRVKFNDIIGEIIEISEEKVKISYCETPIAGWNNENNFNIIWVNKNKCIKLDNGLNSPWKIDIGEFDNFLSLENGK